MLINSWATKPDESREGFSQLKGGEGITVRTGSILEAHVEHGFIIVDGDKRRTVVGQRISGQGLAWGSVAPRGDYPDV